MIDLKLLYKMIEKAKNNTADAYTGKELEEILKYFPKNIQKATSGNLA